MRTIFDGLVEEFRAWHLFEQQAGNSPRRDLPDFPGLGLPEYGAGGYNGPDYRGPDYTGPDYGEPDYGEPDYTGPDFGTGAFGTPDYDRAPRHAPGRAVPRRGGP